MARGHLPRRVGVGVVQASSIPALGRDRGDGVAAVAQQLPERRQVVDARRAGAGRRRRWRSARAPRPPACGQPPAQLADLEQRPLDRATRSALCGRSAHRAAPCGAASQLGEQQRLGLCVGQRVDRRLVRRTAPRSPSADRRRAAVDVEEPPAPGAPSARRGSGGRRAASPAAQRRAHARKRVAQLHRHQRIEPDLLERRRGIDGASRRRGRARAAPAAADVREQDVAGAAAPAAAVAARGTRRVAAGRGCRDRPRTTRGEEAARSPPGGEPCGEARPVDRQHGEPARRRVEQRAAERCEAGFGRRSAAGRARPRRRAPCAAASAGHAAAGPRAPATLSAGRPSARRRARARRGRRWRRRSCPARRRRADAGRREQDEEVERQRRASARAASSAPCDLAARARLERARPVCCDSTPSSSDAGRVDDAAQRRQRRAIAASSARMRRASADVGRDDAHRRRRALAVRRSLARARPRVGALPARQHQVPRAALDQPAGGLRGRARRARR